MEHVNDYSLLTLLHTYKTLIIVETMAELQILQITAFLQLSRNNCNEHTKRMNSDEIIKHYFLLRFNNLPKEFCTNRAKLQDPAGKCFSLHEWWWVWQLVFAEIPAGNSHGHGSLARWNNHTDPRVPATPHCSSPCIDKETHQETDDKWSAHVIHNKCTFIHWFFCVVITKILCHNQSKKEDWWSQ